MCKKTTKLTLRAIDGNTKKPRPFFFYDESDG